MQQTRARQILQSLIQGIDPVTGEELPRETVLQHADVLRALLAGLSALEQTAARAQRRAQLPDNVGRAWTTEEESRLVAAFKKAIACRHRARARTHAARYRGAAGKAGSHHGRAAHHPWWLYGGELTPSRNFYLAGCLAAR